MDKGLEIIGRVLREAWETDQITTGEMETATQWLIDHNQSEESNGED